MSGSRKSFTQRVATMLPALLLGTAVGVAGGAWAAATMDTTAYGETDLNTVARQSQQAGRAAGFEQAQADAARTTAALKAASAERVGELEHRLSEANRSVKALRQQSAKREQRLARVRSSLAETVAALNNASQPASGTTDGQAIEGLLDVTWVLRKNMKPWPKDCAQPLQDYRISVTAGKGATVSSGRLVRVDEAERVERRDVLTLTCSLVYTANLPTPLGSGYEVVVTDASGDEVPLQTKKASSAALADGSAPRLTVSR